LTFIKSGPILGTMKITRDHAQFPAFLSMACDLSPENLSCDGELSRSEVNARYHSIMRDWRKLEEEIGFEVTENEVFDADQAPETDDPNPGVDRDDEHDQFRSDVEADADALDSAGFGEGERDFDERL
jgi:hypothetical protein